MEAEEGENSAKGD